MGTMTAFRAGMAMLLALGLSLPALAGATPAPTGARIDALEGVLGDIHLAEPGALIGFAGARVIEQTVREKLPEGFQRAEYLHAHGILDAVVRRGEMKATLARMISLLRVKEAA